MNIMEPLILFFWLFLSHPPALSASEYAAHVANERAYREEQVVDTEPQGEDFSDTGVGCVEDCLEPLTGKEGE